jgi:hypothetical protein
MRESELAMGGTEARLLLDLGGFMTSGGRESMVLFGLLAKAGFLVD